MGKIEDIAGFIEQCTVLDNQHPTFESQDLFLAYRIYMLETHHVLVGEYLMDDFLKELYSVHEEDDLRLTERFSVCFSSGGRTRRIRSLLRASIALDGLL